VASPDYVSKFKKKTSKIFIGAQGVRKEIRLPPNLPEGGNKLFHSGKGAGGEVISWGGGVGGGVGVRVSHYLQKFLDEGFGKEKTLH